MMRPLSICGWTETIITSSDWSGVDLRRAHFDWPTFTEVNLTGANLEGVNLSRCHLTRVNLTDANLRNVKGFSSLNGSNLSGADLRGANLSNLSAYEIEKATIKGAKYDKYTRWNADVKPEARGAVFVEK